MSNLERFHNSISSIRSHHWKYYCDVFSACSYNCLYCLYINQNKNKNIDIASIDSLKENIKNNYDQGIVYLGATADIYQFFEKDRSFTKNIFELFYEKRIPVFLITRSTSIIHDIPILKKMASKDLIEVSISICSRNELFRKYFEPKTKSYSDRMNIAKTLSNEGIPVSFHFSPIIPYLDSSIELKNILEDMNEAGAVCIYTCMFGVIKNTFPLILKQLARIGRKIAETFNACYDFNSEQPIIFPDANQSFKIINEMAIYCKKRRILFNSAQFSMLDTGIREGGIFKEKLPTVSDFYNYFTKNKRETITLNDLREYLKNFVAVDDLYRKSVENYWDSQVLFENTNLLPKINEKSEIEYFRGKRFEKISTVMSVSK